MMNRFLQNSARGLLRSNLASTSSRRAMVAPLSVGALRSYMILPSVERIGEWTKNEVVKDWLVERIQLHQPDRIHLCDGSEEENELLIKKMVHSGMLIQVNPEKRPNSYLARSPTSDVARVEERTYICSESSDDAGATNNWRDPEETSEMMNDLFKGSMVGRTMYVVPFSMGPIGSPFSITGIQVTDSPYVVASMRIMTRTGDEVMKNLGDSTDFVPCVHSVGAPLKAGEEDTPWPSNPENKYIVHFPEQRRIWSYGSGYGGNALLGKKCLALRIASAMAREEGWLAEHMLIVGITSPEGVKKYVAAAFPSACGKTNLAMMESKLPGWKIECVGDDIAWMRVGKDGQLYAVNPENGFFGVAPGTSYKSNPNAMRMLESNTMFTNVAMTEDGDVWWEDIDGDAPSSLTSWKRTEWSTGMSDKAAHPNARFTVPLESCPVLDSEWNNPEGVPISAIIFGGRRSNTVPLVYQARDWKHGTFVGASMNSETTAAAAGKRGVLRSDPFAMKPFCGYNMADYFKHWLSMTKRTDESKLPKIFHVNWFRKNKAGKFVWPGFGDNIRVIKWIFDRCDKDVSDATNAQESPIGYIPKDGDLDVSGLNISEEDMKLLFRVDPVEWSNEVNRISQTMQSLGPKLPAEIRAELEALESRIKKSAK